jgi:hypothetical protein
VQLGTGITDGRIEEATEAIELGLHDADDDAADLAEHKANRESIAVDAIDLERAARIIEAHVHALLELARERFAPEVQKRAADVIDTAARSNRPQPHPLVRCHDLAWLARETVSGVLGLSRAKELQQEATGGEPLAVCVYVPARGGLAGEPCLEIYPDRVFPAGQKPSGRMFKRWCDQHGGGHDRRHRERLAIDERRARREFARRMRAAMESDVYTEDVRALMRDLFADELRQV